MATDNKGEKEADKIINSLNLPTKIQGKPDTTPLTEQAFFDVYELKLDSKSKEEPLLISGNDSQIVLQTSLLNAVNQLLENRGLGHFDWDDWKEQFERGYSKFTTGASKELQDIWKKFSYPGIDINNRPKIVEIKKDSRKKEKATYKAVQLFPDRKNLLEWVIFSGTSYREIATQIENYWNQKTSNNSFSTKGGELPYLKGRPLVKLYFIQDPKDVGVNLKGNLKKPLRGEISFRLMNKTDVDNPGLQKLTKTDLAELAKAIATTLGGNNPFVWEKGKIIASYRNRIQGFEGWYPVKSKSAGLALITKLLTILKLPIDKTCVKYSETDDSERAYPDTDTTTIIFGETVTLPLKRPIANVRFQNAELQLPGIKKTILLVKMGQQVYKES